MLRNSRLWVSAALAVAVVVTTFGGLYWLSAKQKETKEGPAKREDKKGEPAEIAAVRKEAGAFVRAFNKKDAQAVAAFWTKDGEYIGPDEEPVRGRKDIAKMYAEFFKKHPKARLEVKVETVRLLGRQTALEEGTLKLWLAGEKEPGEARYSVLHVREDDGWRMATVREWVKHPDEDISLKDIEWLVGEWVGKANGVEVRTRYAWDEDRAFIRCRYTLKEGDKVIASGTQVIATDPAGGLRSWLFDKSGSFGESVWKRDEGRWEIEATATLPDGSTMTATNILAPVNKDSFTWQSVDRKAGGTELPNTPPLKVVRVKPQK
jgi:uncharacterized protein (TIGR02246 family)